uniref:Uncharacterized protein n=1 Tax=Odontella aurita TaxID=265563 RepID=A0A7S4IYL0_9STRA|mmetsp:Transcript_3334/g.8627  ORF Transcript_3334/g.8627 Transcript_3334/m.8627 type:complete len:252 (+) Transcript_3334:802-1557(+)
MNASAIDSAVATAAEPVGPGSDRRRGVIRIAGPPGRTVQGGGAPENYDRRAFGGSAPPRPFAAAIVFIRWRNTRPGMVISPGAGAYQERTDSDAKAVHDERGRQSGRGSSGRDEAGDARAPREEHPTRPSRREWRRLRTRVTKTTAHRSGPPPESEARPPGQMSRGTKGTTTRRRRHRRERPIVGLAAPLFRCFFAVARRRAEGDDVPDALRMWRCCGVDGCRGTKLFGCVEIYRKVLLVPAALARKDEGE